MALLAAPAITRRLYGARAPRGNAGATGERSAVELQVLVALADDPEQTVAHVAARLALTPSTVSHAMTALKDAGLIDEQPSPLDARRRTRPLTAAGKRQTRELVARARELLAHHAPPGD